MFYYEDLSCPVCSKRFVAEDDVVVCPQCGLPHHRACWKSIGRCYKEDQHGTEQQWSRETAQTSAEPTNVGSQVCGHCHAQNAEYAEFCMRCGAPLDVEEWHSTSQVHMPFAGEFTPFGQPVENYSSAEPIGESNAADLAAVVGKNTNYYIGRFRRIQNGASGGWNWAAFLFAPIWLFYRKQYGLGTLYLVLHLMSSVASTILYAPMLLAENTVAAQEAAMTAVMNSSLLPFVAILSYIFLALRILLGVRANFFYLQHCERKIAKAKGEAANLSVAELSTIGGVSAGAAIVVAVFLYTIAPLLINMLVTVLSL